MTPPVVLVVDDDVDILELVEIKLSRLGYDVRTCPDGNTGLAAAIALRPALVVLDWMMPGRNGIEVLEAMRVSPETAQTPVLLVTARTQPDDIDRGRAAGADDYLAKPFTLRELGTRVQALIGSAST